MVEKINNIYQESCLSFRLQLLKSISKDHHNIMKIQNFDFEQFIRKPGTAYAIDDIYFNNTIIQIILLYNYLIYIHILVF